KRQENGMRRPSQGEPATSSSRPSSTACSAQPWMRSKSSRAAFDKAQIRRQGRDLIRRQRPRDFRHRYPRGVLALAPLREPTLEIVVREPAEAGNLADALRFGAMACLASGNVLVGNAVFKYNLALGGEFAVAVLRGLGRKRRKICGQISYSQWIEICGSVPHILGRKELIPLMGRKGL